MRITRVELRLVRLPLVHFFETSFGRILDRQFIVVVVDAEGAQGFGECVADERPYYSAETTETAWHVMTRFLVPRLLDRDVPEPAAVPVLFGRVRGHHMAKAALEMAIWDLHARLRGVALARVLGGTRASIESGVSIGIQDSLEDLSARVGDALAAGYRRIKIKIKPGWDVEAVSVVRDRFGAIPLMADANAAYTLADANRLAALDAFDLTMIEQPLDYDDLRDHARLQGRLRTPICLDESIDTPKRAEEAIETDACRVVNIKPGRLGGHAAAIAVHDICARADLAVWHGGMLESGIGRVHNIHLASLPNFRLPGDIAASRRYYAEDLVDPPVTMSLDGTIEVPAGVGLGVEVRMDRVDRATERTSVLRAT